MEDALHFGAVEVRAGQRQVLVDGRPAAIGARAFDVLLVLLEHRDRVVTKDELIGKVWEGRVVEENNLQVQIGALRKVLGVAAIATVPGRDERRVHVFVEHAIGSLQRPMSDAALEAKFAAQSDPVLGSARTAELITGCWRLGELAGVDDMVALARR